MSGEISGDVDGRDLASLEDRIKKALGAVQAARTKSTSPFDVRSLSAHSEVRDRDDDVPAARQGVVSPPPLAPTNATMTTSSELLSLKSGGMSYGDSSGAGNRDVTGETEDLSDVSTESEEDEAPSALRAQYQPHDVDSSLYTDSSYERQSSLTSGGPQSGENVLDWGRRMSADVPAKVVAAPPAKSATTTSQKGINSPPRVKSSLQATQPVNSPQGLISRAGQRGREAVSRNSSASDVFREEESPRFARSVGGRSSSTARRLTASEALRSSQRLYEESQKIKAKKEALAQQTPDGCTFAPQITTKARKPGVATGQERFEHLYRNAAATQKKIDFEREKVLTQSSTFQPKLITRSKSVVSRDSTDRSLTVSGQDAAERLYNAAKKSLERKRELAQKYAEQEAERQRPVLYRSKTPAVVRRTPLYSPANLRKKQETLLEEKLASELQGCTFKPTVVPRSVSVPPANRRSTTSLEEASMPVYDRLKRYGEVKSAKLEAKRAEAVEKEVQGLTFTPSISAGTKARLRSQSATRSRSRSGSVVSADGGLSLLDDVASHVQNDGSVFHRLHEESAVLKNRLREKRRQIERETGVTFSPRISEKSRQIADQMRVGEEEAVEDAKKARARDASRSMFDEEEEKPPKGTAAVFDRLYRDHCRVEEVLEKKRQDLVQKELEACTFRPKTNAIQREGGQVDAVFDRLYSESQTNKEVQMLWAELRRREELEGCTFRPTVNKSVDVPPLRGKDEDVWEWLAKPRKEPQPMKDPEATFHPKIRKSVPGSSKKSAAPESEDPAEVFDRLYANALRSERLRKEVLARIKIQEELAGCTFTPQVNQGYHTGSTGETVHQRLFRHAQHLQEQQRIFEEMLEVDGKPPSPPRSSVTRSASRSRGSRRVERSSYSVGSSEFEDADPAETGYNSYSYDRRSIPIRWNSAGGKSASERDDYLFRNQPIDVNHILEAAIDSPASSGRS